MVKVDMAHERRKRPFGILALSALIAGGAFAQEPQRPRGQRASQDQILASLPPEEVAARQDYERRTQTDPALIRMQREAEARDRAFQATCTALRTRIRNGDRSQLGTEISSACGID